MMLRISLVIYLLLILIACEQQADVNETQTYEKNNVTFQYPSNWDVVSDESFGENRSIVIEAPGSAIFIVQIYPSNSAESLKVYAESFYEDSKLEKLEHSKRPSKSGYTGYFTMSFLGVDVPHKIEFYSNENSEYVSYLIAQTAIEDFSKVTLGFNLIYDSYEIF